MNENTVLLIFIFKYSLSIHSFADHSQAKSNYYINPISTEGGGGIDMTFFKTAITQKIFPIIPPKTPM